jgi:hypothetical protein
MTFRKRRAIAGITLTVVAVFAVSAFATPVLGMFATSGLTFIVGTVGGTGSIVWSVS